jgi:uncharacterized cysteine cluster protein YcgN (CxxCxxCC family)
MMTEIERSDIRPRFWETIPLEDMTRPEWEALCDGCGRCCLLKLEDDDTGDVHYTNVACRLFDTNTCRCGNYALRRQIVAGCVVLTPENIALSAHWMPATCAYRLLYEDQPLYDWHPLISGDADSVAKAGFSMQGNVVAEYDIDEDDLEDYIVEGVL